MFHHGEEDFITAMDIGVSPAIRDEIDGFRGVSGKNNLACAARIDKSGNLLSRVFISRSRLLRDAVNASMNIGSIALIISLHRVKHAARRLRGRGAVEIGDGRITCKNGKIFADTIDLKRAKFISVGVHIPHQRCFNEEKPSFGLKLGF